MTTLALDLDGVVRHEIDRLLMYGDPAVSGNDFRDQYFMLMNYSSGVEDVVDSNEVAGYIRDTLLTRAKTEHTSEESMFEGYVSWHAFLAATTPFWIIPLISNINVPSTILFGLATAAYIKYFNKQLGLFNDQMSKSETYHTDLQNISDSQWVQSLERHRLYITTTLETYSY